VTIARPVSNTLRSELAACCWIPLFALRCEEARRPDFASGPAAVLSPEDTRRVWQVSPPARRAGVRAEQTVSQAIGFCSSLKLCEADPVHYDDRFSAMLAALRDVSPVVEPAELGKAFVGMDGLAGLYGGPERQVERLLDAVRRSLPAPETESPSVRLGWGRGKFVAWVAATRAKPGTAVVVDAQTHAAFLAAQPLAVLPLDADTHRRLGRLGLRTLGDLAALPEEAVTSQFGRAGRRLWRLAAGKTTLPVVGRPLPEPIVASLTFMTPIAERQFWAHALGLLVARALKHPRRRGWRVQRVRARAQLEHGASWLAEVTLREPTATAERIVAPLLVRLDQAPPSGGVEQLTVEFTEFAPGTVELQLFARDASACARAQRRQALRAAAQEIRLRFRRPLLHHVIEVQPWSRFPERRYALIDFEP